MTFLIRELILPPGCLLIAWVMALLLARRKTRFAFGLAVSATLMLYLLSLPIVSVGLTRLVEATPPLTSEALQSFSPQAIVVLGGGARTEAPEYEGATVASRSTLERLAYAAYLAKRTKLPVLVSGGYGHTPEESEAWAMSKALEQYGIATKWREDKSQNTRENAVMSAEMLRSANISRVLLVTGATHARRAGRAFSVNGIQVLAAPTGFCKLGPRELGFMAVIPIAGRFNDSCEALRALLAEAWYSLTGS